MHDRSSVQTLVSCVACVKSKQNLGAHHQLIRRHIKSIGTGKLPSTLYCKSEKCRYCVYVHKSTYIYMTCVPCKVMYLYLSCNLFLHDVLPGVHTHYYFYTTLGGIIMFFQTLLFAIQYHVHLLPCHFSMVPITRIARFHRTQNILVRVHINGCFQSILTAAPQTRWL